MPRVQFNTTVLPDTKTAWGYEIEVTPEGVFGNVPDELIDIEVGAGRVKLVQVAKKPEPAKVAEVVEVVEDKPQAAKDVVENGSGKRAGRPPKVVE